MASKITSSPATGESETQNEHKRPVMPREFLAAAVDGNEAYLNQLLGLNNEEEDHPQPSKEEEEEHPPHMMVSVDDDTPMEPSDGLIRSTTGMEDTILHILSANGHEKLVSKICMKDSSLLKAHNVRNEIPFHHAARFGHENTISKLIHCAKSVFGEDLLIELLRQKNCLGETALHEAARHGHGDVVSTLMEEDRELASLLNDDSVSPLYLATARGSVGMVHNMVEKLLGQEITPAFYSGPKQQTALFTAVLLKGTELTKELLKLYSEPLGKETDETGRTILHFVASTGKHDIAKLLLEKDPSLAYIPDQHGSFPIHTAVRMGRIKTTRLLLQWCPDPCQLLDGNGKNILHIAVEAKTTDVLYKFLNDSKDKIAISSWKKWINRMANATDNKGNTPLHLAAEHEYYDVMLSLLKKGKLDLTLQNKEGLIAVDTALIKLRKYKKPYQIIEVLGEFFITIRKARFSRGDLIRGSNEDDISKTDTRGAKNSSKSVMKKAQFVGLGSILIATVTFSAAFTLPGGTNQDTGTPILGRKYIFKAFIIEDFYAFLQSFFATMHIIYASCSDKSNRMVISIDLPLKSFTIAARSMLIALGLALYLLLAPIGNTGAVVLAVSLLLGLISSNGFEFMPQIDRIMLERQILKHIPDEASGVKPKFIRSTTEIIVLACEYLIPILATFLVIFLFALI